MLNSSEIEWKWFSLNGDPYFKTLTSFHSKVITVKHFRSIVKIFSYSMQSLLCFCMGEKNEKGKKQHTWNFFLIFLFDRLKLKNENRNMLHKLCTRVIGDRERKQHHIDVDDDEKNMSSYSIMIEAWLTYVYCFLFILNHSYTHSSSFCSFFFVSEGIKSINGYLFIYAY